MGVVYSKNCQKCTGNQYKYEPYIQKKKKLQNLTLEKITTKCAVVWMSPIWWGIFWHVKLKPTKVDSSTQQEWPALDVSN